MFMFNRSVPLVWRSHTCLQVGIDSPVLIDGLTDGDRELIELITMGVSPVLFSERASELGITPDRTASLIHLLEETTALIPHTSVHVAPVTHQADALAHFHRANPSDVASTLEDTQVHCVGQLAPELADLLTECGMSACATSDLDMGDLAPNTIVVLTAVWVPDLLLASQLHEVGVAHMQVTVKQAESTVSHVILPALTPCLSCLTHQIIDEDDNWMAGWKGLREHAPTRLRVDPLLRHATVTAAAHTVRHHVMQDFTVPSVQTIDINGDTTTTAPAQFHPACGCQSADAITPATTSSTSSPN